jgi:hypothetical protein
MSLLPYESNAKTIGDANIRCRRDMHGFVTFSLLEVDGGGKEAASRPRVDVGSVLPYHRN